MDPKMIENVKRSLRRMDEDIRDQVSGALAREDWAAVDDLIESQAARMADRAKRSKLVTQKTEP